MLSFVASKPRVKGGPGPPGPPGSAPDKLQSNIINFRKNLVCKGAGKSLLNPTNGRSCHCSICHVKSGKTII